MDTLELSVIVCTHNPNELVLRCAMEALQAQDLPADRWELLVVDNACSEPIDGRRHSLAIPARARVMVETELGLTPARLRGIREACADVLVFVDDDNILSHDYLSKAIKLLKGEPHVGVLGGVIVPDFEQEPAQYLRSSLYLLGLRNNGEFPIRALIRNMVGPWEPIGAGLIIRREIAEHYASLVQQGVRRLLDRRGKMLGSCGDTDMVRCAADLGFYMGYDPALRMTHRIPAFRTRPLYLLRLHMWIAFSGTVLDRIRTGAPIPLVGVGAILRFWVRALLVAISIRPFAVLVRLFDAIGRFRGRRLPLVINSDG